MGAHRRLFLRALLLGICLTAVGLATAPAAQADPHGVFFTVVGQQQLFFNILAALNQADYVEPLNLRTQLRQRRDEAAYVSSQHPALATTQTDLADVLTRQVSLEGEDVRTQERADEYAREVVRQRQAAELIAQYCREAFGSEYCELAQGPNPQNAQSDERYQERNRAFVQDPVNYSLLPVTHGAVAALLSGTDEYQQAAQLVLDTASRGRQVLPLAYSPEIATLRAAAKAVSPQHEKIIENIILGVAGQYVQQQPEQSEFENLFRRIAFDSDGVPIYNPPPGCDSTSGSAEDCVAGFVDAKHALEQLQQTVRAIAESAQQRVALQLETADGAIADRVQKVQSGIDGGLGEISVINTAPANVKEGLQEQLLPALLALEGNPAFVDPSQINVPGGVSAVDRDNNAPLKIGTPLEPFSKSDVIEQGLLEQAGVTKKPGFNFRNQLQQWIADIVGKL